MITLFTYSQFREANQFIDIMSEEEGTPLTYKQKAIAAGRNFTVTDVPPLGTSILLGFQHYLTMLGATVSSRKLLKN